MRPGFCARRWRIWLIAVALSVAGCGDSPKRSNAPPQEEQKQLDEDMQKAIKLNKQNKKK
jgi:hypothetical protein